MTAVAISYEEFVEVDREADDALDAKQVPPQARTPRCSVCDAPRVEGDHLCADHRAYHEAEEAPCTRCGRQCGHGPIDGVCRTCREDQARAAEWDGVAERLRLKAAELEASPHRCVTCGTAHVMAEGERCIDCRIRAEEAQRERARLAVVYQQTLETIPKGQRWSRFRAPELAARVKDPTAIERAARAFQEGATRYLLTGPAGVGKTSLATSILWASVARLGAPGMFIDAFQLAVARQVSPLGEEAPLVTAAIEAEVLLLDDLGAERSVPSSPVAEVIHRRHADEAVTIVTCAFGIEQIAERYGDGIARRLAETPAVIEFRRREGAK